MACLKKDEEEQIICTLYVSDEYRGLGIETLTNKQDLYVRFIKSLKK